MRKATGRPHARDALLAAFALWAAAGSGAATVGAHGAATRAPNSPPASAPATASTREMHVGSVYADESGHGSPALIMIAGLASGAYVWNGTAAALRNEDTIFALTLAGFDGKPPAASAPLYDAYAQSIVQLVHDQRLTRPILVGHSLGGDVALYAAEQNPALFGGLVIVDSLPLYPPLPPTETLQARERKARTVADRMKKQSDAQFAAAARKAVAQTVGNPGIAKMIVERSLRSDRATVAEATYELSTTNLGPGLSKISIPVVVLAAGDNGHSAAATKTFYQQQYAGTPHLEVEVVPNAHHFIMYDQPRAVRDAIEKLAASQRQVRR